METIVPLDIYNAVTLKHVSAISRWKTVKHHKRPNNFSDTAVDYICFSNYCLPFIIYNIILATLQGGLF